MSSGSKAARFSDHRNEANAAPLFDATALRRLLQPYQLLLPPSADRGDQQPAANENGTPRRNRTLDRRFWKRCSATELRACTAESITPRRLPCQADQRRRAFPTIGTKRTPPRFSTRRPSAVFSSRISSCSRRPPTGATSSPPQTKMARPEGFEPPTGGFGDRRSTKLSYGRPQQKV